MANSRQLRHVTLAVLRWYLEFEDGMIESQFDHRLINYRIDVEAVIDKLGRAEREFLFGVHRDGLSPADAATAAGLTMHQPDNSLSALEAKVGRMLYERGLFDVSAYLRN